VTTELKVLVTVESPRGRQTLAVPDDVPVEQLLPALVEVSGCEGQAERWSLRPRGEGALEQERSLGQNGVYQGAILELQAEESEAPAANGRRLASWAEVASYQARNAVSSVWQSSRRGIRPLARSAGRDAAIAGAVLQRGLLVAVISEEPGAGATTVTALLATLLARLRSDRVAAVDADVASGALRQLLPAADDLMVLPATVLGAASDAGSDAFFAELRRTTDLAVIDCGVSSAPPSRAALAHADVRVVVSRAPAGGAPWWERNARPIRLSRQPAVTVVNRTQRSRLPRAAPAQSPGADRTVSLTHEPAAAARLRTAAFSWDEAPRSWQAEVRALATGLLVEHL
jgi:Mrp family chromosome partitioning ATPase